MDMFSWHRTKFCEFSFLLIHVAHQLKRKFIIHSWIIFFMCDDIILVNKSLLNNEMKKYCDQIPQL